MAANPAPSPTDQLLQVEEEIAALDIISALPEESRKNAAAVLPRRPELAAGCASARTQRRGSA
nr:hypothetical protein [Xanthomonas vasicola]MDO6932961.1 hypothetical protein [Xanthomonas vasicola]MDO6936986.1 hypothetical protein [Xanthomonas vasicola]MDO6946883.1 hypothetical protein [Xanthomonas vasicola]MDO6954211.1 hypothetical protein [Xanthomonas vasicola]MDO6968206.1 hypothetical protein [Xanthomonas vasicola]